MLHSSWLALSSLPWSAPSATRPASHPGESGVQTGSNMRFYSIGRRAKIWRGKICNPIGCLVTVQYAIPLASAVKSAITLACVVKCAILFAVPINSAILLAGVVKSAVLFAGGLKSAILLAGAVKSRVGHLVLFRSFKERNLLFRFFI